MCPMGYPVTDGAPQAAWTKAGHFHRGTAVSPVEDGGCQGHADDGDDASVHTQPKAPPGPRSHQTDGNQTAME